MILDNQVIFSNAQAVTLAALEASTNVLDLGAPGITGYNKAQLVRRMDKGHTPLLIQVVDDFAGAMTSMNIAVQQSVDAAFTVPVTLVSEDVAKADLIEGYKSVIDELPNNITMRFIRIAYTMNGTATDGSMTSGIVSAIDYGYKGNA